MTDRRLTEEEPLIFRSQTVRKTVILTPMSSTNDRVFHYFVDLTRFIVSVTD